jgi:hypothetical protein
MADPALCLHRSLQPTAKSGPAQIDAVYRSKMTVYHGGREPLIYDVVALRCNDCGDPVLLPVEELPGPGYEANHGHSGRPGKIQ